MIGYHPALDPAHAAFRASRLFLLSPEMEWEWERLRIADFILLFPSFVPSMTLPQQMVKWRSKLRNRDNRYWYSGDPFVLFNRIRPMHEVGVHLLAGIGAIDEDRLHEEDCVSFSRSNFPEDLLEQAAVRNERDPDIPQFLREVVLPMAITGPSGLKARTGLMEHRYDAS